MTWPKVQTVVGSFLALANTTVVFLISVSIVTWTDVQKGLVLATVNAGVGLAVAVYAHFLPSTPPEPVAIGGALTAFVTASLGLAAGFAWWTLSAAQVGVVVALVTSLVAFGTALFARSRVTPNSALGVPAVSVSTVPPHQPQTPAAATLAVPGGPADPHPPTPNA